MMKYLSFQEEQIASTGDTNADGICNNKVVARVSSQSIGTMSTKSSDSTEISSSDNTEMSSYNGVTTKNILRGSLMRKERTALQLLILSPQIFLENLMHSRGYEGTFRKIKTLDSKRYDIGTMSTATGTTTSIKNNSKTITLDYQNLELHDLAINSNDEELTRIMKEKSPSWLSKYAKLARGVNGETLLHIICRYCKNHEVLKLFLEKSKANIFVCDKYGRTPLHYVCWRIRSCFKMMHVLIRKKSTLQMFFMTDVHNSCPLSYATRDQWKAYNLFINAKKNIWFKPNKEGKSKKTMTKSNLRRQVISLDDKVMFPNTSLQSMIVTVINGKIPPMLNFNIECNNEKNKLVGMVVEIKQ